MEPWSKCDACICNPLFIVTCGVCTRGLCHRNTSCTNVLGRLKEEQQNWYATQSEGSIMLKCRPISVWNLDHSALGHSCSESHRHLSSPQHLHYMCHRSFSAIDHGCEHSGSRIETIDLGAKFQLGCLWDLEKRNGSGLYTLARKFTMLRRYGVTLDTFISKWPTETLM